MSRLVGFIVVAGLLLAASAPGVRAQSQAPAKPQTTSLDSEAPPGAPPHWLPNEPWVMQHWLPYDEKRLHRLLGVDRGDIWRWLRDDTRSLAQLALERGWEPEALARELIAPWRRIVKDPAHLRKLEQRALRTLTQGHLAQHILFHSLHQEALPTHSPEIFGVASRAEWSFLRRSEMSPVQICRINGLSRAHAERAAAARLRKVAEWGVRHHLTPAAQGRRLLDRQLRQLPRSLQQTRYNGPPPIATPRESPSTAANYSNNATLSSDGRLVAFESYEAKLPTAKTRGEIAVMVSRGKHAPTLASAARALPSSNYNPAISADGSSVVFESAKGNLNFAKRYGEMHVLLRDLRSNRIHDVSHPRGTAPGRSAYNPTVSGDGEVVAYEAYEESGKSASGAGIVVRNVRTGDAKSVAAPAGASSPSEPRLSADGQTLAFTALIRDGDRVGSRVFVRDVRSGRVSAVSRPGEEAWEPSLSQDGSVVAYTAGGAHGGSAIVVRELATGTVSTLRAPAGWELAFEPSLSHDGRRVPSPRAGRRCEPPRCSCTTCAALARSSSRAVMGRPALPPWAAPRIR